MSKKRLHGMIVKDPPAERHELKARSSYDKIALSGETWHTYSLFIPKDTPKN